MICCAESFKLDTDNRWQNFRKRSSPRQEVTHTKTVCHLSGNGQVRGFLLYVSLGRDCCKKDYNDRKTF